MEDLEQYGDVSFDDLGQAEKPKNPESVHSTISQPKWSHRYGKSFEISKNGELKISSVIQNFLD